MDEIDLRIVRLLTWLPHDPIDARRGRLNAWDVATELGLHGTTVKRRIQAMHEAGVLRGVHMIPAPSVLRQRRVLQRLTFAGAREKADAVEALRAHALTVEGRGAMAVLSFAGDTAWVLAATPEAEDVDAFVAALALDVGAVRSERVEAQSWGPDPDSVRSLDRAILAAHVDDALVTPPHVAEALGVTPKTVRVRLARLTRLGAFSVVASEEPSRLPSSLALTLVAEPRVGHERDVALALLNAFPHAMHRSAPWAETPYVTVATGSLDGVDDALARAQSLRHVVRVEMLLLQSRACNRRDRDGAHPLAYLVRHPAPARSDRASAALASTRGRAPSA